jgi:monoamine oxidase
MSEQPPIPPHVLAEATAATQASVNQQTKGHVAVVGGGIAGLTAAYRLMQQGFKVTIIESAQDVGGHVTSHEALDANGNPTGLYVDEGGEIVEANSHLEGLCNELGVPLLSREESNGRQLYYVNGKALTAKEIHDGYAPLAEVIEDYRARLKSDDADVRAEAFRELREAGTIDGLLAKHADKVSPEMVTMIKQAYKSEVGRNTDEQDAFNLVTFIGTDPNKFDPYAGSNEGMTFEQGGSSLINALKAKLRWK